MGMHETYRTDIIEFNHYSCSDRNKQLLYAVDCLDCIVVSLSTSLVLCNKTANCETITMASRFNLGT